MMFHPTDFCEVGAFELEWRWPDSTEVGAHPVRSRIRALTPRAAQHLAHEAIERALERTDAELLAKFDARADAHIVRDRLAALPVISRTKVIVSWNDSRALLTSWQTFVDYWDDFCYPSSDDVTIWAPGSRWTLNYRHSESFDFGFARVNSREHR